jgi:hypothetical protein
MFTDNNTNTVEWENPISSVRLGKKPPPERPAVRHATNDVLHENKAGKWLATIGEGNEWQKVDSIHDITQRAQTLTAYDYTELDIPFPSLNKSGWRYLSYESAKTIKTVWASGVSNSDIANIINKKGFGIRTVAEYAAAFARALEKELSDRNSKK